MCRNIQQIQAKIDKKNIYVYSLYMYDVENGNLPQAIYPSVVTWHMDQWISV